MKSIAVFLVSITILVSIFSTETKAPIHLTVEQSLDFNFRKETDQKAERSIDIDKVIKGTVLGEGVLSLNNDPRWMNASLSIDNELVEADSFSDQIEELEQYLISLFSSQTTSKKKKKLFWKKNFLLEE